MLPTLPGGSSICRSRDSHSPLLMTSALRRSNPSPGREVVPSVGAADAAHYAGWLQHRVFFFAIIHHPLHLDTPEVSYYTFII